MTVADLQQRRWGHFQETSAADPLHAVTIRPQTARGGSESRVAETSCGEVHLTVDLVRDSAPGLWAVCPACVDAIVNPSGLVKPPPCAAA